MMVGILLNNFFFLKKKDFYMEDNIGLQEVKRGILWLDSTVPASRSGILRRGDGVLGVSEEVSLAQMFFK